MIMSDKVLRKRVRNLIERFNEDKVRILDLKCFDCGKVKWILDEDGKNICEVCEFKDERRIFEKKDKLNKEFMKMIGKYGRRFEFIWEEEVGKVGEVY